MKNEYYKNKIISIISVVGLVSTILGAITAFIGIIGFASIGTIDIQLPFFFSNHIIYEASSNDGIIHYDSVKLDSEHSYTIYLQFEYSGHITIFADFHLDNNSYYDLNIDQDSSQGGHAYSSNYFKLNILNTQNISYNGSFVGYNSRCSVFIFKDLPSGIPVESSIITITFWMLAFFGMIIAGIGYNICEKYKFHESEMY